MITLNELILSKSKTLSNLPIVDTTIVQENLQRALTKSNYKVIVLDDDPTGIQTVNGIYVFTDWSIESIREGFDDPHSLFYILTNSRGLTIDKTIAVHEQIANRITEVAKEKRQNYLVISRSDSTLRGHYPIETEVLKQTLEANSDIRFDGEVIIPFFEEGGRYTLNNIHYVQEGDNLVPAGQTEFAQDKTFGYKSSHLGEWIEEKTASSYPMERIRYFSIEELRALDYRALLNKLMTVHDFNKVVVNAASYDDVRIFVTVLLQALEAGKHFIFRSAAAFPKILGNVSDKPLLTREELVNVSNKNGGFIIIGSHVQKTTAQLEKLLTVKDVVPLEFNQHLVLDQNAFRAEIERIIRLANDYIANRQTVVVYTRRHRFDLNLGNKDEELQISLRISSALTHIASELQIRPNFMIAKGGITSSEVGVKALKVRKALVLGQILQGVPVWLTGNESKFPNLPYVIFPGNVGDENSLLEAYEKICPTL